MPTDRPVEGLLGDLEQAVMGVVWAGGAVTVRQVYETLRPDRKLAYTTVMTVMGRLVDKEVLDREKQGRAFIYRAVQLNRGGFIRRQARLQIQGLLRRFGDVAIAAFMDELVDGDAERLAALEALLTEHQSDGLSP